MARIKTIDTGKGRQRLPERVLEFSHKTIARELHPTGGRDATNTSPSSSQRFYFTCTVCFKTAKARLVSKTRAIDEGREHRGCVFCGAPQIVRVKKKPQPLSAQLRKEVIADRRLTPVNLLFTNSRERRRWVCSLHVQENGQPFIYSATISARTNEYSSQGCPCCSSNEARRNLEEQEYRKCLEMLIRDERNEGYLSLIADFPIGHKVYFRCELGHERYCSVDDLLRKDGCLTCFSNLHKGRNLADPLYRALWPEFVCAPNYPDFELQDISSGSSTVVCLWQCQGINHPPWLAYPFRRTRDKRGCPYCAGKRLAVEDSLAVMFPEIAAEYDSWKNLLPDGKTPKTATAVRCSDRRKHWFICSKGHSYEMAVYLRTSKGRGCPSCVSKPLSLAVLRPDLAKQWYRVKNKKEFPGLSPESVTVGSNKKVWWQCCFNKRHYWKAQIKDRVVKNSGCPRCNGGRRLSKSETIASKYPELSPFFDVEANRKSAAKTLAVLRKKYFWNCANCEKSFERRLQDVVNRGVDCGNCQRSR